MKEIKYGRWIAYTSLAVYILTFICFSVLGDSPILRSELLLSLERDMYSLSYTLLKIAIFIYFWRLPDLYIRAVSRLEEEEKFLADDKNNWKND